MSIESIEARLERLRELEHLGIMVSVPTPDLRLLLDVAKAARELCVSRETLDSDGEMSAWANLFQALDALEAGK